jgi:peptide/nickel transport system substrate-binding protein
MRTPSGRARASGADQIDLPSGSPWRLTNSLHRPGLTLGLVFTLVTLVLSGCAPPTSTAVDDSSPKLSAPSAPKVLRIGQTTDPLTLYPSGVFHAALTYYDERDALLPAVASKVPSIADGDWRATPDGKMEVTWKLKPGLIWHDGAPLTSDDFAFAFRLFKEKDSRLPVPRGINFASDVVPADPQTFVVLYSRPFNSAAIAGVVEFPALPSHILEPRLAQLGADALTSSPFWGTEWVGLGPYRLTSRVMGGAIEAEAFPGFFNGRPKIDKLIIQPILDYNALLTALIGGALDGVLNLNPEQADVFRNQWVATGQGTIMVALGGARQFQLNYRDPTAPWAADRRVRQAMIQLIDRQSIADVLYLGFSPIAYMAAPPTQPIHALVEQRGLPKYDVDRRQAELLLDEAGWLRGADGRRRNAAGTVFTHNPSGLQEDLQELTVVVESYRAGGISSEPVVIPGVAGQAANALEIRASSDSTGRTATVDDTYMDRFRESQTATLENRWQGANTGGYSNPAVEPIYQRWVVALDPTAKLNLEADFQKVILDDIAVFPTVYRLNIPAFRTGVIGPTTQRKGYFAPVTEGIEAWTIDEDKK